MISHLKDRRILLDYNIDIYYISVYMSKQFAITVTLKPLCYDLCPDEQYGYTKERLYEVLRSVPGISDVYLVCELTKENNCHYHGILETKMQFSAYVLKQMIDLRISQIVDNPIGYICVKRLTDRKGWNWYIHKKPFIPSEPYLFDDSYEIKADKNIEEVRRDLNDKNY